MVVAVAVSATFLCVMYCSEVRGCQLQVELDNLRQKMAAERRQQEHEAAAATAAARVASAAAASTSGASVDEASELLQRTVKVSWDPTVSNYSSDQLRDIFAVHGPVDDVILKEPKKKRKHKAGALVVLASPAAALEAAQSVHGDINNPLLVLPYSSVLPDDGQPPQAAKADNSSGRASPLHGISTGTGTGSPSPLHAAGLNSRPAFGAGQPMSSTSSKPLFPSVKPLFAGEWALMRCKQLCLHADP